MLPWLGNSFYSESNNDNQSNAGWRFSKLNGEESFESYTAVVAVFSGIRRGTENLFLIITF